MFPSFCHANSLTRIPVSIHLKVQIKCLEAQLLTERMAQDVRYKADLALGHAADGIKLSGSNREYGHWEVGCIVGLRYNSLSFV